jgi:hypothetical protein
VDGRYGGRSVRPRPWASTAVAVVLGLLVSGPAACEPAADAGGGWWVERYAPAEGHLWLELAPDGAATALRLTGDRVTQVRADRLPAARRDALAAAARRALAAPERRSAPGLVPEGEILRIGGTLDGRQVSRSWRPEVPGAEGARALSAAAAQLWAELPPVARRGAYVRAEPVDAERAALLRREKRFPFLARARAEERPSIAAALAAPGRFVFARAEEATALGRITGDGHQLFVDDGTTFEVTVAAVEGGVS